jgi:coiled-coil and C2 domain-containing protein 2A
LTGFPIQLRYSGIQQILETVERTGIHLCEDNKVEYAMAVYIHFYPNDVLSIWVFVVSMIPKQK